MFNVTDDLFKNFEALALQPAQPVLAPATISDFYASQMNVIKAELAVYDPDINALVDEIKVIEVEGEAEKEKTITLGLKCKNIYDTIEKQRKTLVAEPNDYVKAINGLAQYYQTRLKDGEAAAKAKISAYSVACEQKLREQAFAEARVRADRQAKIDAETARLNAEAARLNAEIKATDSAAQPLAAQPLSAPQLPLVGVVQMPKTTRTAAGKSTIVKTWEFAIENEAAVPREFLTVDHAAIKRAVKDGQRQIPGVRIFEETTTRFGK